MKAHFGKGEDKSIVRTAVGESWQMKWDAESKGRHYYNIRKSIKVKAFKGNYRKEEVVFSRLRLGNTRLKSTLFKWENAYQINVMFVMPLKMLSML